MREEGEGSKVTIRRICSGRLSSGRQDQRRGAVYRNARPSRMEAEWVKLPRLIGISAGRPPAIVPPRSNLDDRRLIRPRNYPVLIISSAATKWRFSMDHRFSLGIDLGTSNSAIALSEVDSEQTDVIELTRS